MPTPAFQLTRAVLPTAVLASLVVSLAGCPASRPQPPGRAAPAAPVHSGLFHDVAAQSGIRFTHDPGLTGDFRFVETTPGGCAFLDYDRDGRLDVFLIRRVRGRSG
jgi:enediyne biosynthesis protein E4